MTTATHDFHPGNLVRARNREWVVQASDNRQNDGSSLLRLRPLGGADEDIITLIPELEFAPVEPASQHVEDEWTYYEHIVQVLHRIVVASKRRYQYDNYRQKCQRLG